MRWEVSATLLTVTAAFALAVVVFGSVLASLAGGQAREWFSPTVNFGQLVQAFMLLVVFYLAHHHYFKLHDARKKRVEIRIDVAGDVAEAVRRVHTLFLRCAGASNIPPNRRIAIDGALRDYSNAVRNLGIAIEDIENIGQKQFEKIRQDREDYKDLVTEFPYPSKISTVRISAESTKYGKIQENILRFRLDLSNSR